MPTPFTEDDTGSWAEQSATSKLDYGANWADWFAQDPADTIASSNWSVDGAGLTLSAPAYLGFITSIWVEGGSPDTWYTLTNSIVTTSGRRDSRVFLLYIKPASSNAGSVFASRQLAIAKMRRDRLVLLGASILPSVTISDDLIWDKLRAAESTVAHELRVPLVPTAFFPSTPTNDEITALAGMPWKLDPGYDYNPNQFRNESWGMIRMRNKPIREITKVEFKYLGNAQYILPLDWVRLERRLGTVQFVPTTTAFAAPLATFMMQAVAGGRTLPLSIQMQYVAGIENASQNYPELIDLIYKTAALKLVQDAFLPQSGSISADGLSQSMSMDVSKYEDSIDRIMNGGKGSNGGLMVALHGVRMGFVGGS